MSVSRGRSYTITVYGTNLADVLNIDAESADLTVDTSTITTVQLAGNKVRIRFRLSIDVAAATGPQYLTLDDDAGNSLRFPVVVK